MNMQATNAAGLPAMIRKVLGSPHAELVIKRQIIQLAAQHLHIPEVTTALLEVLPLTKDKETKDTLLHFLSGLNTSRFTDLDAFYGALLQALETEQERAARTFLLQRLAQGLHQDQRLAPMFLELMGREQLSEPERLIVTDALASLPAVTEETALLALQRCAQSPALLQETAVDLAERVPAWGPAMAPALQPYLDVKVARTIRFRILERLSEARSLTPAYVPLLTDILRSDPDADSRYRALGALAAIRPWDAGIVAQLMWTATQDGDDAIRSKAVAMQGEMPELPDEQLIQLAGMLSADRSAGVRIALLELLQPVMRVKEVREAVAAAFAGNPGVFEDAEFEQLLSLLSPYAGREEGIRNSLLQSVAGLPRAAQRSRILQLLIPRIRIEAVLETLVSLFRRERDAGIRATLFGQIKGLSVTRHPALVDIFCKELAEPGSPFREHCAGILANAAEHYPQIVATLEDVLLHDSERELVRLCLDGYLRPGVTRRFEVLLEVLRNELLDTASRQQALDAVMKLPQDESQQETLTAVLSGLKPGTLKINRP
jgi:hypothetical protein